MPRSPRQGWAGPNVVVDEIAGHLHRARDEHASHRRVKAVAVFEEMIASMNAVEPELRKRRHQPSQRVEACHEAPLDELGLRRSVRATARQSQGVRRLTA